MFLKNLASSIANASSYVSISIELHQQLTNPLLPIFSKQSRMPLQISNIEHRQTTTTTCQNKQQQNKSKPK